MSEPWVCRLGLARRRLSSRELASLRRQHPRATLTRTSLELRGSHTQEALDESPLDALLHEAFDVAIELHSSGLRTFKARLPLDTLSNSTVSEKGWAGLLERTPGGWLVGLSSKHHIHHVHHVHHVHDAHNAHHGERDKANEDSDGNDEQHEQDDLDELDAESWLDSLTPLHDELASGDTRALYIGWLAQARWGESDVQMAVPTPAGLHTLSRALEALIDFVRVEPRLVSIAAETSESMSEELVGLSRWVETLDETEKHSLLVRAIEGENIRALLLRRFRQERAWSATATHTPQAQAHRTVKELLERLASQR
ncbi:MAG: hypothetical protein U0165_20890 [Polyangiaceae bacterium]